MKYWLNTGYLTDLFALLFFHWWIFLHQKIINCILYFFTKPGTLPVSEAGILQASCPLRIKLSLFMISWKKFKKVLFVLFLFHFSRKQS